MKYISTRGGMEPKPFLEILIGGLAPDGGLILPEETPRFSAEELERMRPMGYCDLAREIIGRFATDIPREDLRALVEKTYTVEAFRHPEITPITPLADDVYILGLSYGPTLAFKDIALQMLGNLFEYELERTDSHLNVLGATSGDTGSSAEYAMLGKHHVNVFMLSPHGKMSPFQSAQMYSLDEPNIFNIAIRGVFDNCQDIVKQVNGDAPFKQRYHIGSVNSINWARVAAQIVYYFKGYFAVTADNSQQVSFSVPSGNFGNIYAGHLAREMGLPIHRLILATNENNVLDEFFRTGVYRPRPPEQVYTTSSPSMDIAKASNFERFIFEAVGCDSARMLELWRETAQKGAFDLNPGGEFAKLDRFGFISGSSTHADRLATIRKLHAEHGKLIDPHTADGVKVGLEQREVGIPLICLETALPIKFAVSIEEALGERPPLPEGFEDFAELEGRPQQFELLDPDSEAVKAFISSKA